MPLERLPVERLLREGREHRCKGYGQDRICVRIVAIADLPSRSGPFEVVAFQNNQDGKEHVAFVRGDVTGAEDVLVRLHSECLTGDAIGSLRCDCRDQLETSLQMIGAERHGVLLYLRQEGRGIGLVNKVRAYALQDEGLDTVEANRALGFQADEREYSIAAHMLASLEIRSVRLLTNNPSKIEDLATHGIRISQRVPLVIPPNRFNRYYLETKARQFHHFLPLPAQDVAIEQAEVPLVGASERQAGRSTEQHWPEGPDWDPGEEEEEGPES